jgi:glycosyltransferase involved in cell wall biosynthesis
MMKDEVDVAYHVVSHLASEGIDLIIVADNGSTDGTRDELERAREDAERHSDCEVQILDDDEVGYYQAKKMTHLVQVAGLQGAEWVVPFDADELWYYPGGKLADALSGCDGGIIRADLYNHFSTALDSEDENPFTRMQWRQREKGALPKVAVRWNPNIQIHQGNHDASWWLGEVRGGLELRHFPWRSWEHLLRKVRNGSRAYAATDLDPDMGAHWRTYAQLIEANGEQEFREQVYEKYFWFFSPLDEGLLHDPAPFRRWDS